MTSPPARAPGPGVVPAADRGLVVRSEAIDLTGPLLARLPAAAGALAWLRAGHGLVGWGSAARLEVRGTDRFAVAQRWWRRQVDGFEVYDGVGARGSGPIAFGSFAFDDRSGEPSVLVVPEVVLGRVDGVTWLTTTGRSPRLSSPEPISSAEGLRYSQGQTSVTAYRAAVAVAIRDIAAGRLDKVVLAHDLLATADQPLDPRFLLAGLADRYPDCWTFAVDGLVGATPELLVARRDGGGVTSRVLAGTTARGGGEPEDRRRRAALLASHKDREEHRFAVESLTQALDPHCRTLAAAEPPYPLELSNVVHLATDVAGTARESSDVLDLVAAVHPTAAVGGTPTGGALTAIRRLEGMDRGRYAGPVGWLDAHGNGEWGIALRCAQVEGRSARLFAGCGIVAESDPDAEVAEAQAKFVPMRDALEGVRS